MWNLFTVGSLQFLNDSTIASLEANQNRLSKRGVLLSSPPPLATRLALDLRRILKSWSHKIGIEA